MGSCETGAAGAGVAIDFVGACPSIEARALRAVGDVRLTVNPGESRPACASVGVHIIFACGSVLARGALTFVDLQSTARPRESWQTTAVVRVHPVCTGAAVQTRIRRAVVDVCLAVWSCESTSTCTDKAAKRICAGPTVFTWVAHTLVDIVVAQLSLPPRLAFTLIAQVVRSVGADCVIGTWVRGARGEDVSTSGTGVRWLADAGETCHAVHTRPFVQTRAGRALIDVDLAEVTSKALSTFAAETVELVDARAGVLAGTWQTVVPVQITVLSHPPRFTITAVTVDVIPAGAVDTGAAPALVHLRIAVRWFKTFRTLAVEAVLLIHARPAISAGAGGTLVDLHIAFGTCKAWFANTVITVDAVFANSIIARVTGTVIEVYLAVGA